MFRYSMFRLRRLGLAAAVGVGLFAVVPPSPAAADGLPDSMAGLGDSITRAFNACGWYVECTSRSWSTGSSVVNSHYQRILAHNPGISGHNYSYAVTGAKASGLVAQAERALRQQVDYVTIEIGANDACTSSESTMTPVATYRAQIGAALAELQAGLPKTRVFVSSIPDLRRLWSIGSGSASARSVWDLFDICQSMLANPASTSAADRDRRNRVRQRVIAYNQELSMACSTYGENCRFDDNDLFDYEFGLSQISTWDYFHPNTKGQQVLAEVSWHAGFDW